MNILSENYTPSLRLALLEDIATSNATDIISHKQWNFISHDFILVYELIKDGKFPYINKIPKKMFDSYLLSLSIFNANTPYIKIIPIKYLNNPQFIIQVLNNNYNHLKVIPKEYWQKPDIIEWICSRYSSMEPLKDLPLEYKNNYDLCSKLVNKNGNNYFYLSDNLKNNIDIFNAAKKSISIVKIFPHSGFNIRNNNDLALEALKISPEMYNYVSEDLKKNVSFFLSSLISCPHILEFSNNEIKDNEQCVWESVKIDPLNLQFASERILELSSFCSQLSENLNNVDMSKIFKFWSLKVRSQADLVLTLLPKLSLCLEDIGENLYNNESFVLKAIPINPNIVAYLGDSLSSNSLLFIKAFNTLDKNIINNEQLENAFDIFKHITPQAANNIDFILPLYQYFKDNFITSIFPKIKHLDGLLINLMNDAQQTPQGLFNFMEKLQLRLVLEKDLNSHGIHKLHKI